SKLQSGYRPAPVCASCRRAAAAVDCGPRSLRPHARERAEALRSFTSDGLKQFELAVLWLAARWLHGLMLHQLGFDVAQERRWLEHAQPAAPKALPRVAEDQAVFGPRHGDVEQAPLFRYRRLVGLVPMEGQHAVLQPNDEHDRKLQALRGVQGQERYAVGARVPELRIRRQRGHVLEARRIIAARCRERGE